MVLDVQGKIIIGDKALYHYHNSEDREFVDLAKQWNEKYNLPFVFARLCFNSNEKYLKNLSKKFINQKVYIPQYILKQYSQRTGLSNKQIIEYLDKISYKIDYKERRSLKLFFKLIKEKGI